MPSEFASEERSDEPRVASVVGMAAAAARDAGGVPDAPCVEPAHRHSSDVAQRVPRFSELLELKIALLVLSGPNFTDA